MLNVLQVNLTKNYGNPSTSKFTAYSENKGEKLAFAQPLQKKEVN